jgi:fatty acid desaturase
MNKTEQEKLNLLYRMLNEKEKDFERRKVKRAISAIIGFAIFYFLLLYLLFSWSFGDALVIAPFFAIMNVLINAPVFYFFFDRNKDEAELLDIIRKKIKELEERK